MQNKNLCTKIGFLGLILMCVCLPMRVLGIQVKLDVSSLDSEDRYDEAKAGDNLQRYNHVHFVDNGNDFGGILYISKEAKIADGGSTVELSGETYGCESQYHGVYYNSERGERLWPLDKNTQTEFFSDLEGFNGGLYFNCKSSKKDEKCIEEAGDDPEQKIKCLSEIRHRGVYGAVNYSYSGQNFSLIAGVEYNTGGENWIEIDSNSIFAPTFDLFNDIHLMGLVYDTNGGVGFVGCEFSGDNKTSGLKTLVNEVMGKNNQGRSDKGENIYNIYSSLFEQVDENKYPSLKSEVDGVVLNCEDIGVGSNKVLNILVEGLAGAGVSSNYSSSLANLDKGSKMQFFSTVQLSNKVLINYAKKKAELLCRGRWDEQDHGNGVVCFDGHSTIIDATSYNNKTLIVKNGKVNVSSDKDLVYDIFVDKGMLYIDDDDNNIYVFDKNGSNIESSDTEDFNNEVWEDENYAGGSGVAVGKLLRGNFIINGLVGNSKGITQSIKNKYFIHGKFTSMNPIDTPLPENRLLLLGVAGVNEGESEEGLVSLGELFTWDCTGLTGSDNNACPHIGDYWMAPLVVIERNFPSALLK